MGGAVSSGRDNNELIDNLMGGQCIRTRAVERVFRALDRADYMMPEARDQAYKDLAWRYGLLHMSAPCIYSEVMEGLELKPGLSFLNIGSGTGYLSTLVGLILGSGGISHGVEVHSSVVDYSRMRLSQFLENSPTLDDFDFCEPKFYCGNGLCLAPLVAPYDRVYCGAGCPEEYQNYFKQLIKVGGILMMPLNDNLLQIKRVSENEWVTRCMLNVSFATLRIPKKDETSELLRLEEQCPARLQQLCRGAVRTALRGGLLRRHPELREPTRPAPDTRACPRRICIPVEDDSDVEGLDALHDLDRNDRGSGAHEMNALLSLVLSMGHNRVAGALRFDSPSSSDDEGGPNDDDDNDDDGGGNDGGGDGGGNGGGNDTGNGGRRSRGDGFLNNIPVSQVSRVIQRALQEEISLSENDDRTQNEGRTARRLPGGVLMFELRDPTPEGTSTSTNPSTSTLPDEASKCDPKDDTSNTKKDQPVDVKTDDDTPGSKKPETRPDERTVPSEVEIYLGKNQAETSGEMEWEAGDSKRGYESSDDDSVETKKDDKRQKFDSGIGEETTPSSGASSKSESKSEESDRTESNRSDSLSDDNEDRGTRTRRRLQKRGFCQLNTWSSSSTEGDSGEARDPDDEGEGSRRKTKKRSGDGGDARRVRLSLLMKRGIKELPLPPILKKYVNWGRCYQI